LFNINISFVLYLMSSAQTEWNRSSWTWEQCSSIRTDAPPGLLVFKYVQSKFEANWSRGPWVMIGQKKTDIQAEISELWSDKRTDRQTDKQRLQLYIYIYIIVYFALFIRCMHKWFWMMMGEWSSFCFQTNGFLCLKCRCSC